jgi:hypothetical protein
MALELLWVVCATTSGTAVSAKNTRRESRSNTKF